MGRPPPRRTAGTPHRRARALRRVAAGEATVDGSPILLATVLPAVVLLVGRSDIVSAQTARTGAIVVAFAQLAGIGALVARIAPTRNGVGWIFAAATACIGIAVGIAVGIATVVLGH